MNCIGFHACVIISSSKNAEQLLSPLFKNVRLLLPTQMRQKKAPHPLRARGVQPPLIRHRHRIPNRHRIRKPRRAHRIQNLRLRVHGRRAQRLVLRLLAATARVPVVLHGDPVFLFGDLGEALLVVRVERYGVVGDFAQADDDEEAVFGVDGAEVAVGAVFAVGSVVAALGDEGRCLRSLRAGREGCGGGSPVVGFVDVSADNGAYFELRSEERNVLAKSCLVHGNLIGGSFVRD